MIRPGFCRENARIRRVVETLIDGTFSDGGTGMFRELYDSLTIERQLA